MKLKNIANISLRAFAAISLGLMAGSCDDLLDTEPQGVYTNNNIGDEEAVDLMTAAYATLLNHYFGNNESFAGPINNWVFDVRSDDALKGGDGVGMEGYIHQLEVGNVESDNPVADLQMAQQLFLNQPLQHRDPRHCSLGGNWRAGKSLDDGRDENAPRLLLLRYAAHLQAVPLYR